MHNLPLRGTAPFCLTTVTCALLACASSVQAFKIDTGNPDFKLRWDNTIKYSASQRLKKQSDGLNTADDDNQDDGNNNFDKGLVSSRLDLLSELDASYGNFGARISAAAWYDEVYHKDTDNDTVTSNHSPANEFSDDTKETMGEDSELLDAFIYGRFSAGDGTGTVRLGRHTLLWGESLFFGSNGIAGGQAPIDLVKLLSVPNSQFKEISRPLGKLSVDVPLNDRVSMGAYLGYEWEKTRFPPAGAYLSSSDVIEGERIITAPLFTGAPTFENTGDIEPADDGQYGLQVRWSSEDYGTDYGVYLTRYHAFGPSGNLLALSAPPNVAPEQHRWAYHEGIQALGASFATSVDNWSLAGEISIRDNAPLNSISPSPELGGITYDNKDNPGYAVGTTAHAQFSWIASLDPSAISREASFVGEIAWNQRVSVDKNKDLLNPNADRSATAVRMIYTPTYRQLFSGMDVSPTVGVGYTWGGSSAVGPAFGVDGGGDANIGVNALYLNEWKFSLNYTTYLGPEGGTLDDENHVQFKQALKDRDFISFSASTTF